VLGVHAQKKRLSLWHGHCNHRGMSSGVSVARQLSLFAVGVSVAASVGCAPASEEGETEGGATAISALASSKFDGELAQLEAEYDRCVRDGKCAAVNGVGTSGQAKGASAQIHLQGWGLRKEDLCGTLAPLRGLEHAYFFVGGAVEGGAVVTGHVGVDFVWDLWDRQAAGFWYRGAGFDTLVGVQASAYMGYGFGDKADVLDAWSGTFETAGLSVALPVLKLGVGAQGFRSPDNSVIGGAAVLSVGLDFLSLPVDVDATISTGEWTASERLTHGVADSWWFVRQSTVRRNVGGKPHDFVQFRGGRDVALSILQTTGTAGVLPAAHAVAIGLLKDNGWTLSQACPR
jgi:hypothetical protein